MFLNFGCSQSSTWSPNNVCSRYLILTILGGHSDYSSIYNLRVINEDSFELRRCNLEAAYFDELLLSINHVPEPGFGVAVDDVPSIIEAISIEFLIGVRVVEIAGYYSWATNAEFASHIICRDVSTEFVDNPNDISKLIQQFVQGKKRYEAYLTSRFGKGRPMLPVSSRSGQGWVMPRQVVSVMPING